MKEIDVIDKLLKEIKDRMNIVKKDINSTNESMVNDCMEKINKIETILKEGCPVYDKLKK